MSQPKTLLEMAGADMTPNALSDSALVLIDYQMEYVTGGAFDLDGEGGQIAPQVAQADGEAIVRKTYPSPSPAPPCTTICRSLARRI